MLHQKTTVNCGPYALWVVCLRGCSSIIRLKPDHFCTRKMLFRVESYCAVQGVMGNELTFVEVFFMIVWDWLTLVSRLITHDPEENFTILHCTIKLIYKITRWRSPCGSRSGPVLIKQLIFVEGFVVCCFAKTNKHSFHGFVKMLFRWPSALSKIISTDIVECN